MGLPQFHMVSGEATVYQRHLMLLRVGLANGNLAPGSAMGYQSYLVARDSKGRVQLNWSSLLPELPFPLLAVLFPADEKASICGHASSGPAHCKW